MAIRYSNEAVGASAVLDPPGPLGGTPASSLPQDALNFSERHGLMDLLGTAHRLARRHLGDPGRPDAWVVVDPDTGREQLRLDYRVGAPLSPERVLDLYDAFTDSWLECVTEEHAGRILVSVSR